MLHAPTQVDGHMVVGIDGVNGQTLLLNALDMIGGIVHFTVKIIIGKGATSDSILTIRLHHKADAVHFVQQGVRVMGQLILQLIPVEGDHLIEVDLLAAGQDADLAALLRPLGAGENGGAQLCVFCKVLLMVHGMAEAQPDVAGNGQAGQGFQQADGPVPPLVSHVLLLQLPVLGQGDGQLRPLQLVFGQLLRHMHPVGAHAHGDQRIVVLLRRGGHHADVHMDVRGGQLMEYMLEITKILLDVPLDGLHLLLGVDLGTAGLLVLEFSVLSVIVRIIPAGFPGDFQGHLLLRQSDTGAAGDGVLVICRETDGLPIVQFYIVLQHIGGKACQEVPQITRLGIGTQHLHLVFAKRRHSVGVAVHAMLIPPEAEPDPVEDGQLVLAHLLGKALIEPGLKHHAAGVDAGGIFLAAAGGNHLGEQLALFQQILFFAQHRYHQVGTVLFGYLDRILPHIVVFRIALGLASGDGIVIQADGGEHIAYFKHQRVIVLLLAGVIFIHGDVPLFLHIPDELLFIPFCLRQQHKAGEDASVVTLVLGFCLSSPCNLILTRLNHCRGVLVLRVQLGPPLGVGDGLFLLTI